MQLDQKINRTGNLNEKVVRSLLNIMRIVVIAIGNIIYCDGDHDELYLIEV